MKTFTIYRCCLTFTFILLLNACESFLDAGNPFNEISKEQVFTDEILSEAAVTSIYAQIRDGGVLSGGLYGLSILKGLYTDELIYYGAPGLTLDNFYNHTITPTDGGVLDIWTRSYKTINMINAVLENIESPTGLSTLSTETRNQLKGECLFLRGVIYFYLVNLYGNVPHITTTNFEANSTVSRTDPMNIYQLIVSDMDLAKNLVSDSYLSTDRTRTNTFVVAAFLARIHLYMQNWSLAEAESSYVLENTTLFQLEQDLSYEFLKESTSTIWHLTPKNVGENTSEANNFIFLKGPPPNIGLNPVLIASMEEGDLRKSNWIGEVTNGINKWYYPHKYRYRGNTGTTMEYPIILRLSEQYLIRAESRALQGDLEGSKNDLNLVRQRSGLNNIAVNTKEKIIEAIFNERKHELFTEHGHRWFDILRSGRADSILSQIKTNWKSSSILLPVPESEILMNPNLLPQNPGY